jgi:hypothetical protein
VTVEFRHDFLRRHAHDNTSMVWFWFV